METAPCGCSEPTTSSPAGEQHAIRWRAWYIGGLEYDCRTGQKFDELPSDGVLGVKVFFSNNTARVCSGDDYYGMLRTPDGFWTIIHNSHSIEENIYRYPNVVWKRGKWTCEAEIQRVVDALMSAE